MGSKERVQREEREQGSFVKAKMPRLYFVAAHGLYDTGLIPRQVETNRASAAISADDRIERMQCLRVKKGVLSNVFDPEKGRFRNG